VITYLVLRGGIADVVVDLKEYAAVFGRLLNGSDDPSMSASGGTRFFPLDELGSLMVRAVEMEAVVVRRVLVQGTI
jgi:hypothetical protein